MSILDMFKSKEKSTEQAEAVVEKTEEQATEVKKPKHGEDGVCCGGCQ